jgi:hypothetical protein
MQKFISMTVVLAAVLSLVPCSPAGAQGAPGPAAVSARDDWKAEFEAICAGTQDSAAMTSDELKNLIDRCDKLRSRIEKLDETPRKVYLKRLQMCRDLYAFVLEYKGKK